MTITEPTVLITGASSGIGRAIALRLGEHGFNVFGTSRTPSADNALPGGELLPLDVRDERSVRACVDTVMLKAGRLDVLVNNAGYPLVGAIEEASMEQAQALFQTNFLGVVRMVKAALPVMRGQGRGKIINISSGMALARTPFLGFYSASKCALEGYSETLWHELLPLGISVSIVEPGFFRSNIESNTQIGEEPIEDYHSWRERALDTFRTKVRNSHEPAAVADCVLRISITDRPTLHYTVGKDARITPLLRRLLPRAVFRAIMRRYLGLNRVVSESPDSIQADAPAWKQEPARQSVGRNQQFK